MELGIAQGTLDAIEMMHPKNLLGLLEMWREMFVKWENNPAPDHIYCVATILSVLKRPQVQEGAVANSYHKTLQDIRQLDCEN